MGRRVRRKTGTFRSLKKFYLLWTAPYDEDVVDDADDNDDNDYDDQLIHSQHTSRKKESTDIGTEERKKFRQCNWGSNPAY